MTEEALTTATACLPSVSSSSSMAALVMEEVMMTPGGDLDLDDAVDGALLYGDDGAGQLVAGGDPHEGFLSSLMSAQPSAL